jgi:putative MATE family efflux protein
LNLLQVVNMLLDTAFVGRLEPAALTAVGGSTNVVFLMFSIVMAFSTSATALVSRSYGARKQDRLRVANRQCLSVALVAGAVCCALTIAGAGWSAHTLLPADALRAKTLMVHYLVAMAVGLPGMFLVQALAGSLRGIGDTRSPLVISGIQILLHIALNYVLIFPATDFHGVQIPGAGWGLAGAGWAVTISAWVSAAIYMAWVSQTPLGSCWRFVVPTLKWTRRIVGIAAPATVMSVVRVSSLWAFTKILSEVPSGATAIGAMSAGFRIESIMFMPAFGLSIAAAALVGQSLGAQQPERAERIGWVSAHCAAGVILAVAGLVFAFAHDIALQLVPRQPEAAAMIATFLRYLCVTEVMFGYAMVLMGAMQGAGDTVRPMWATVVSLWGMRVPMAFVCALVLKMGADGAWLAMSATQAVQGLLTMLLFKQGKWKDRKVL